MKSVMKQQTLLEVFISRLHLDKIRLCTKNILSALNYKSVWEQQITKSCRAILTSDQCIILT